MNLETSSSVIKKLLKIEKKYPYRQAIMRHFSKEESNILSFLEVFQKTFPKHEIIYMAQVLIELSVSNLDVQNDRDLTLEEALPYFKNVMVRFYSISIDEFKKRLDEFGA
jgi:uncharacterized protein YjaZ